MVTVGDGKTVTLTSAAGPNGQIVAGGGGFDVNLSYTYAEALTAATFGVTVFDTGDGRALDDPSDSTTSGVAPFDIADAPLDSTPADLTPPMATEGAPLVNVTVFHFTDENPEATAADYSALGCAG